MDEQLVFDWPTGVALGPDNFFVSQANEQAFAMIQAPDNWPEKKLCLTGPRGAGKSHLARVYAARSDATVICAKDFRFSGPPDRPVVVEDMEGLAPQAEEPMFHLVNNLRAAGLPLLMTARTPPARWTIALPDLASRMQATTLARISDPDDALLRAVMIKLFADRQLMPSAATLAFLDKRIERSFDAASRIVTALDTEALQQKKAITPKMARLVLDRLDPSG